MLRVEQGRIFLSGWIARRGTIRFEAIARRAGKTKIAENRLAARRSRDDVLKLENGDGQFLRCLAVRATVGEMGTNASLKIHRDIGAHVPGASAA
jgi:hypothetical protein